MIVDPTQERRGEIERFRRVGRGRVAGEGTTVRLAVIATESRRGETVWLEFHLLDRVDALASRPVGRERVQSTDPLVCDCDRVAL